MIKMIKKDYKQKNLVKDIEGFLKKKKKKSNYMVVIDTKIYQKDEKQSLLSIEKNINEKKGLIIIIRNYYTKKLLF